MSTTVHPGELIVDVDDYATYLRDHDRYLMLQYTIMQKAGFVAQTVAALLEFVDKDTLKTYASVPKIAAYGCLPVRTVRRHLEWLNSHGHLWNRGRENPAGRNYRRRTCTLEIGIKCKLSITDKQRGGTGKRNYAELPRWAARCIPQWTDRFVYACILSRRLAIERWESNGGCAETRLAMSAAHIAKLIGRKDRIVWRSLDRLEKRGFIRREPFMELGNHNRLTLPKSMASAILPDDWIPPK